MQLHLPGLLHVVLMAGPTSLSLQAKPLTLLHVFHHSLVVFMAYFWLDATQSLQHIALLTNTAIHVIMYYYYYRCSIHQPPKWKRLVTSSQIVQFVFRYVLQRGCSVAVYRYLVQCVHR